MKRKLVSALLATMIVFALLPVAALAAVGGKGGTVSTAADLNKALGGVHTVSGRKVTLTQDVILTSGIITERRYALELDLAGHTITLKSKNTCVFLIEGTFSLYDSSSNRQGRIIADKNADNVMKIGINGTFNQYGGHLDGQKYVSGLYSEGVYNFYAGKVTSEILRCVAVPTPGNINIYGMEGEIGLISCIGGQNPSLQIVSARRITIDKDAYVTLDGEHVTGFDEPVTGEIKVYRGVGNAPPKTGDGGTPLIWLAMCLLAITGLTLLTRKRPERE